MFTYLSIFVTFYLFQTAKPYFKIDLEMENKIFHQFYFYFYFYIKIRWTF